MPSATPHLDKATPEEIVAQIEARIGELDVSNVFTVRRQPAHIGTLTVSELHDQALGDQSLRAINLRPRTDDLEGDWLIEQMTFRPIQEGGDESNIDVTVGPIRVYRSLKLAASDFLEPAEWSVFDDARAAAKSTGVWRLKPPDPSLLVKELLRQTVLPEWPQESFGHSGLTLE